MAKLNKSAAADLIRFRSAQARLIPTKPGVYALCDLDEVPIYVGCSVKGIRGRVRRHLTSARSDILANRLIDVWELAYVWAWPVQRKQDIRPLEAHLFHKFDARNKLMNMSIPVRQSGRSARLVPVVRVSLLPDVERNLRKEAVYRFPRQIEHLQRLVDHILIVKDDKRLHRALTAHFKRLERYHRSFVK
jgi:hypothetical protein